MLGIGVAARGSVQMLQCTRLQVPGINLLM